MGTTSYFLHPAGAFIPVLLTLFVNSRCSHSYTISAIPRWLSPILNGAIRSKLVSDTTLHPIPCAVARWNLRRFRKLNAVLFGCVAGWKLIESGNPLEMSPKMRLQNKSTVRAHLARIGNCRSWAIHSEKLVRLSSLSATQSTRVRRFRSLRYDFTRAFFGAA
jgi:hypothetical protein